MQLIDSPSQPTGQLYIEISRNGKIEEIFEEKNLVVDTSKSMLSRLLGGAVAGKSITTIGFGTNGLAPVNANSALTTPFTKAIDGVSYPAANQVTFNFSLASTEANGLGILEFGLLSGDGTLFARRIRSAVLSKDTDISLTGTWTITF